MTGTPLKFVKAPPARIPPSGCTASAATKASAPVPKLMLKSTAPPGCNRTIRFSGRPLNVVNAPPTSTRPSGCRASASTNSLGPIPGLKLASSEPSRFSRIKFVCATPLVATNAPPTRILPSVCRSRAYTDPLAIRLPPPNVGSTVPSPFKRPIRLTRRPAMVANSPPMTTFPSGCNTRARTPPLGPVPVVKVGSSVPSAFSRATKLRLVWLTTVNKPPSTTRPSFCTATAVTRLSAFATKLESSTPPASTRARLVRPAPATEVNKPPNTTLPALVVPG